MPRRGICHKLPLVEAAAAPAGVVAVAAPVVAVAAPVARAAAPAAAALPHSRPHSPLQAATSTDPASSSTAATSTDAFTPPPDHMELEVELEEEEEEEEADDRQMKRQQTAANEMIHSNQLAAEAYVRGTMILNLPSTR